ncbi:MAG: hypothetical protein H8E31_03835 [Planctomycetes bacterium]|nr:hypothetical protein [Planctomycetota bacterium]
MAVNPILHEIDTHPLPATDGWGWLYRSFERLAPPGRRLRRVICRYFQPSRVESWRGGLLYRLLGVPRFGRIIPTGGITVRRLTRARMRPYTLAGTSLAAARAFYPRACVFEFLHLPFLLTLAVLSVHRAATGRPDLALENTLVNLVVNVYPVMHHRRTRLRIVALLRRRRSRGARPAPRP